jgi:PAS domain S-box-containing protein
LPLLLLAEQLAAGFLLCLALIHGTLGLRQRGRLEHQLFAFTAFLAALEAIAAQARFTAETVPELLLSIRLSFCLILAFAIPLLWFARSYAGMESVRLPVLLTVGMLINILFQVVQPYTLTFERIDRVGTRTLPWGEQISVPIGKVNPYFLLTDLPVLLLALYMVAAGVRLWRNGPRSRAVSYWVGLGPLLLFIYPHGTLVHMGILPPPHLYSFGFLTMGLMMSRSLVLEAIRSADLAREVEENERRWRSLRDNVLLAVVGCDRDGRVNYVNPFMERATGQPADQLVGRDVTSLVVPEEAASLAETFAHAIESGQAPPVLETRVRSTRGEPRVMVWSNVVMRGSDGSVTGTLSVGQDATEIRAAEAARDRALSEIEKLKVQLERENTYLRLELEQAEGSYQILGRSDAIKYVLHKIQQVAATDATVLIEGETGVGKELVARALHEQSARSGKPFVRVNCAALPVSLVESELFGHQKGAFTGADRERKGRFELAESGTIMLDEVGELNLEVQSKLLRVLQWGEYERVGSSQTKKCDVRVVAATNRTLKQEVAAGRFREDLYYRLNVFPISVPPLRDRREDIPELVTFFVRRFSERYSKNIVEISVDLMHRLSELPWPGNVRELENFVERMVIISQNSRLAWPEDSKQSVPTVPPLQFATLMEMEKRYIEQVLVTTNGQISGKGGAAEILGINPNTLRARMAKLGVVRPIQAATTA